MSKRWLANGLLSTWLGIGWARFSFTPLAAMMVEEARLSSMEVSWFGSALLVSYALGAFAAAPLGKIGSQTTLLRAALLMVPAGLALESWNAVGFYGWALARSILGFAGGLLMVLGPSAVLKQQSLGERPKASAMIFSGIGLGVVLGSALVYLLQPHLDSSQISGSLALLALPLAAFALFSWPTSDVSLRRDSLDRPKLSLSVKVLLLAYCADAIAYIPHTIYLSDYVAHELQYGSRQGGQIFIYFGLGALAGPWFAWGLQRYFNTSTAVVFAFFFKSSALVLAYSSNTYLLLAFSASIVGAMTPGIVSLVALRLTQIVPTGAQIQVWGWATGGFAVAQALGGTLLAGLYQWSASYQPLFGLGAFLLTGASLLLWLMQRAGRATAQSN